MADIRTDLTTIGNETIAAVDPVVLLRRTCCVRNNALIVSSVLEEGSNEFQYPLSHFKKIFLVSIGKAAEPMACYFLEELRVSVSDGVIITKERTRQEVAGIPIFLGGHPVPSAKSIENGAALIALSERANADTLVINCISGGASALCCAPWRGSITLDDLCRLTQLLLENGLTIEEMNCIRSQISEIKGGRYLQHIHPAESLSLILSDVRYDNLHIIASGLTEYQHSRHSEAIRILEKYNIWERTPASIRMFLSAPERTDTVGSNHDCWWKRPPARNKNIVIGNNYCALQAASASARRLGYTPIIFTDSLFGEARRVAEYLVAVSMFYLRYVPQNTVHHRYCLLFGGETTVTVRGSGMGGRNQEITTAFLKLALCDPFLNAIIGHRQRDMVFAEHTHFFNATTTIRNRTLAMISFSTDGNDGPTEVAGGLCDYRVFQHITQKQDGVSLIDNALKNNDSYHFLKSVGALYASGYSATNVCDVQCVLIR